MKNDLELSPDWKTALLPYLPPRVRETLARVRAGLPLEELRIRVNAPLQLVFSGYERLMTMQDGEGAVTREECEALLNRFCEQSVYAWETELGSGFLTLAGGYRVGVCGGMTASDGRLRLSCVTGFNIRIARQMKGVSAPLLPLLLDAGGGLLPTLLVSAPGAGKTTMLRDIARAAASGLYGARPCRVAVVDTRYELAASAQGVPRMDLGPRTDVLSGVGRAEGMRMMVTNMSPDVLVTDEIATDEDARAVFDAINCGVAVVASAHAGSLTALARRGAMRALLGDGLFERLVLLGRSRGTGTVEQVCDARFAPLARKEDVCSVRLLS